MPEPLPKLAFVQAPTANQRADADEAEKRGEIDIFLRDLEAMREELARRGVEVRPTYSGEALPDLEGLSPDEIFAFGSLATMWRWLGRFGWLERLAPSYPRALDHLLNRRTWKGTPGELLAGPAAEVAPVFVKTCRPCFRDGERFDGQVWPSLARLADLPPELAGERFLCAERVGWVSEYRCSVLRGRVIGVHAYQLLGRFCGPVDASELERYMPEVRPSPELLAGAIAALEQSGEARAAYALDFGLIAHGRMALVEMNDAVALTSYGLSAADNLDLHLARWRELARGGPLPNPAPGR